MGAKRFPQKSLGSRHILYALASDNNSVSLIGHSSQWANSFCSFDTPKNTQVSVLIFRTRKPCLGQETPKHLKLLCFGNQDLWSKGNQSFGDEKQKTSTGSQDVIVRWFILISTLGFPDPGILAMCWFKSCHIWRTLTSPVTIVIHVGATTAFFFTLTSPPLKVISSCSFGLASGDQWCLGSSPSVKACRNYPSEASQMLRYSSLSF